MLPMLLIALALVLSQGMVVAHGMDHLDDVAAHDCGLCLHVQTFDSGPAAGLRAGITVEGRSPLVIAPTPAAPSPATLTLYPIRGPPRAV